MKTLGPVGRWPELEMIYRAIVDGKPEWKPGHPVKVFKSKGLRYVDHGGKRYVEQNPNTQSAYARAARSGAKIVWVIDLATNQYLGLIEDGVVKKK